MPDSPSRAVRPQVIVTRRLPDAIEARMTELFAAELNHDDRPFARDALGQAVQVAEVLVPTVTDAINAALIDEAGPQLRLIASFGAGVDHIDLRAARARGIIVTNTPGVLTEDTADMTMALILSVPRRLAEGQELIRSGGWQGWSPTSMLGRRLGGKTLGIVGMGRIGQAVARRARPFGLAVHYHNRRRLPIAVEEQLGVVWQEDLDAMLGAVDIVSINCPHTAETHHLIDARRLALMRPDAFLVNTARGEIIVEEALIAALEAGRLAGAGLDVFPHEPHVDPRLLALANVTLQPHMGSATIESRTAAGAKVIANIRAWADGHRPPDQVLEGWA